MRTEHPSSRQDSSGIPVAPGVRLRGHGVPGDGGLRITREAGPQLVLAGDIDLNSHAALIAALALAEAADGTVPSTSTWPG